MVLDNSSFDDQAAFWWDEEGPFKMLHKLNIVRCDFLSHYVPDLTNLRVLDVGCGGGIFSESMASQRAKVSAIDTSRDSIEVAKLHAAQSGLTIDYQNIALSSLSKRKKKFELITCMEMLEHVESPEVIINDMAFFLQSDGYLLVSTIHRNVWSYLKLIVAAEYLLGWIPTGTHDYAHFIKPSELIRFCESQKLSLVALSGVDFVHDTQSFCMTDDVSSNYMALFRK